MTRGILIASIQKDSYNPHMIIIFSGVYINVGAIVVVIV